MPRIIKFRIVPESTMAMKLFRIGEVSRLYDVSPDTLRHYEKLGILKPEQTSDSGYRYYSNKQLWQLNIIRTLRKLDVSLPNIRDFMVDRTLDKSEEMLSFQVASIERQQRELSRLKKELKRRQSYLSEMRKLGGAGTVSVKQLPTMRAWRLEKPADSAWEVDRVHRELLAGLDRDQLQYFAWGRAGAIISEKDFAQGNYLHYACSFILDDSGDTEFPAGDYLSLHFHGEYSENIVSSYSKIKTYMALHHLELAGPVRELYKLDIHETDQEEEYLTEVLVPVCRERGLVTKL